MNLIPIVKVASGLVTTLSAGAVVGNIIKASTPPNLKLVGKIGVAIGGFVLAAVAGDLAAAYVEEQIDDAEGAIKWAKSKRQKAEGTIEVPVDDAGLATPEYPAPGAELDDEQS